MSNARGIIGTPVTTLPGAWRYRDSTGTGRPSVSILWLGEVESLICIFLVELLGPNFQQKFAFGGRIMKFGVDILLTMLY